MIDIKVKYFSDDAKIPKRAHKGDAGFDMVATSIKETTKYIEYGTAIGISIPIGYVGLLFPRSSVTDIDLMLKNSIGVIDSGYLGEIKFRFYKNIVEEKYKIVESPSKDKQDIETYGGFTFNYIPEKQQLIYNVGDRIGQIIFMKLPDVNFVEVDDLGESERGVGGLGSTNK